MCSGYLNHFKPRKKAIGSFPVACVGAGLCVYLYPGLVQSRWHFKYHVNKNRTHPNKLYRAHVLFCLFLLCSYEKKNKLTSICFCL